MFARVSAYDIPDGRANEATMSLAEALDRIAAARGFAHAYFLISRESNRGVAVTFWEDHDAMTASRVTATRLRGDASTPSAATS